MVNVMSKEEAIRKHLMVLPEPERSLALSLVDPEYIESHTSFDPHDPEDALYAAFNWSESPQGDVYWTDWNHRYHEILEIIEKCRDEEEEMNEESIEEQGEHSYHSRTTTQTVLPKGEPLYSDRATQVSIVDEMGGEFLIIEQKEGAIRVSPEEWTAVRDVISRMVGEIWDHQQNGESC